MAGNVSLEFEHELFDVEYDKMILHEKGSDLTDSDKYDKKQPVENGDIEIMECEPLYAQVRKEMNPNNTYVSFQGEYNEPEDNGMAGNVSLEFEHELFDVEYDKMILHEKGHK
jgi:hypothetical protein